MHQFDPHILREYDIRGTFGKTLNPQDAYEVGIRLADQLPLQATVCVARDGRLSSPTLLDQLVRGLMMGGCHVMDLGVGPTPMLYYGVKFLGADAGIMVTGSHNPPSENGLKITLKDRPFYGEDIKNLAQVVPSRHSPVGTLTVKDIQESYVSRLLKNETPGVRDVKAVWDPGHGAASAIVASLLPRLPGDHTLINGIIDGRFPAHHPDPSVKENLTQLIDEVKRQGAEVGIAFDGDGDRIGVVDTHGNSLWGDQLMFLYSRDVLARHPRATVIADVKTTQLLFDEIKRLNGKPHMAPTGHSLIKVEMAKTGALLAGEMSGHMFFADDYYGYDDGIYAAIRLLRYLAHSEMTLAEYIAALPKAFSTPEIRLPCSDAEKFDCVAAIQAQVQEHDVITVDGVRVNTPDGWLLVRASNTQPMIVARCESQSPEGLEKLEGYLNKLLTNVGVQVG